MQIGDVEHIKIFSTEDAAKAWLDENDPEGVAFQPELALAKQAANHARIGTTQQPQIDRSRHAAEDAALLRRPQTGRGNPITEARARFREPRLPEKALALRASGQLIGLVFQLGGQFGHSFFQGAGLLHSAAVLSHVALREPY
jgi:hypothetical protein